MTARLLAAGLFAALLFPQPAPASPPRPEPARAAASVEVAHLMFMPGKVAVGLGETVTWTFPEVTSHTTTSDQGFWDSGTKSGGATYSRAFTSAGRFAYHCTFHSTMRGSVAVPVVVTAPSQAKRVIRWSTVKGADGTTFDVQLKRGPGKWADLRVDTTKARTSFKPADKTLAYKVRARTSRNGADSRWSKPVTIIFA